MEKVRFGIIGCGNIAQNHVKNFETGKIKDGVVGGYKKVEEGVVSGYKKIEDGVVGGYKKIEQGVVSGYTKIEDKFVDAYLTKDGETVEEAKERMHADIEKRSGLK